MLDPLGLAHSSFEPTPETAKNLTKAYMWTIDGRTFDAPTFQMGIAPSGSMYTTVGDLGRDFIKSLRGEAHATFEVGT